MLGLVVLFLFAGGVACAQPLTLPQAVDEAVNKYPATRVSLEQVSAAAATVNLARTAYLPRADFVGQINRATRNNVFGLILPQPVIPAISGPVLGTNNLTSAWGSAAGVLASWEPFDFGLRRANVDAADSARRRAEAGAGVTRFEVEASAADAFLTLAACEQAVVAARAGVDRARVLNQVVEALANAELRPGADAARTRAELARAETQLIQAEQAAAVARASLAQLLGAEPAQVAIQAGPLLALPPASPAQAENLRNHPLAQEQDAAVAEVKAREHALARSYFPRFSLMGAVYARGTGNRTDGSTGGAFSGIGPNIQNWALGMNVSFAAFDLPSLHARQQAELHRELAETAQYQRVLQDLGGQRERARAQLEGARRVAANTPIQLEAARTAEQQAQARYRAGLGAVIEVAEAQRLLTQAEIEDSLAKLGVWRALLAATAAEGDLDPFLRQAGK